MEEYKIGVGGCGKALYKTCLEDIKKRFPHLSESNESLWKPEKPLWEERKKWDSIFKGIGVDADPSPPIGPHRFGLDNPEDIAKDYEGRFYRYSGVPEELSERMRSNIGYSIGETPPAGYVRCPETELTAFALDYVIKAVFSGMFKEITPHLQQCKSILFFVGLGGGTGTGIINPTSKYWQAEHTDFPTFALGVLGGEKIEGKIDHQGVTYYRRDFNTIWALSDLLTGGKVHGVILVDNDRICEIEGIKEEIEKNSEYGEKMEKVDEYIIKSIFPMLDRNQDITEVALRDDFMSENFTPILVPCYWTGKGKIEDIIKKAIDDGKLAECDINKADRAYVFVRGICNNRDIINYFKNLNNMNIEIRENDIWIAPNVGGRYREKEVLILLRNPDVEKMLKDRIRNAINFIELIQDSNNEIEDKEIEGIVREQAKGYLHINPPLQFTEEARKANIKFVEDFEKELKNAIERIERGERQIFKENVKIRFGYLFSMDAELEDDLNNGAISEELSNTFANSGFPLSGNVTIIKNDDEWEIADEEKEFVVRKEEGKLNVYRSLEIGQEREIRKRIEQIEEKIKSFKVDAIITETGQMGSVVSTSTPSEEFDSMLKVSEELKELKDNVESLRETIPSEDIEELKEKVKSLSNRSEALDAEKEQGITTRLKEMLKIKPREVSKPSLPEDKINSILKDVEDLKKLKNKVKFLSSRSETLEAGEKLSTLYWLKQMTEINLILKDIEELKKLKDKVEPLGKPLPSKDIEELREKVESLSSRSETLEAGEKQGSLNWLKQMVKIKPRRVEVSKLTPSEEKINSISKDFEELKKKTESLPSEEKKEIGGRIIEEEII